MPTLSISNLQTGYGDLQIVDGVDLTVEDGEYVAVIGPNGAGKSTLLRSVFGLTDRMGGQITFDGDDLTEQSAVDIVSTGLGLVPQESNVFPDLTVEENLKMGAYTRSELPDSVLSEVFDRFPVLEERLDQQAGELSGGQQQMVAISRALVTDPELLFLDEPSAGLAPDLVQGLFDEIDSINERGTAVLVVEQNAREVLQRADRGYVLTQGQIRLEADADEMLSDEEIQEQFFGN